LQKLAHQRRVRGGEEVLLVPSGAPPVWVLPGEHTLRAQQQHEERAEARGDGGGGADGDAGGEARTLGGGDRGVGGTLVETHRPGALAPPGQGLLRAR
jgi:hypothetical protein